MIVLIDYDLLNLQEDFDKPNYNLLKYYAYYKKRTAVEVITTLAEVHTIVNPELIIVFSEIDNISKKLWEKILIPVLDKIKSPVQLVGRGFQGFKARLPDDVVITHPDYSAYFPWLKKMIYEDKVSIGLCHKFTKTDVIDFTEGNYEYWLDRETNKSYCAIVENDFIYSNKGIEFLTALQKKYLKITFYQPFKISKVSPELLMFMKSSTRIINNHIILDEHRSKVQNVTKLLQSCPSDGVTLIPERTNTPQKMILDIERILLWLEALAYTQVQPKVLLKDSFLELLPKEWAIIYRSIKTWTNFEGYWRHISLYEAAMKTSYNRKAMRQKYGKDCDYDNNPPIYVKDGYLKYLHWFFKFHLNFDMRLFFINRKHFIKKELNMTAYEIKEKRRKILTSLEKEVKDGLNHFVLNPHIQTLYAELSSLQANCPHVDEAGTTFSADGVCPFCGKVKI